ncbi:3-isopropylmalate dehydrogenase [Melioribacter sp. Ez-97]|uniref:3-isopropylmalate dehydrogenase n=1 Tax=unclassified Melioribacter TaxID=2627329 RepID=UPI003BD0F96D
MYRIALLPGDGIGPEVVNSAVKVLKAAGEKFNTEFEFKMALIGGSSYDKFKTPLTDETLDVCYSSDVVFLGAVGGPEWENLEHHLKPEAALLKLRKALGLFANLRPARIYNSMLENSSLRAEVLKGTDVLILRELTGGIYFGEPRGYDDEKGFNTMVYTKGEVERIARKAFELARQRNKKVTSVDKANVLEVSQFWRKVVMDVHKEYQDVQLNHMYVDNAAMQIVRDPKQFDVILTSNLFGDILSDIAAMITGSLGMLPSASLGTKYALYEPVHGSAPDIAGKGVANPIAAISSAAMMLKYSFQMDKASEIIENSIENVLSKGYRTRDIFKEGNKLVTTEEMTNLIIEEFEKIVATQAINVFTL